FIFFFSSRRRHTSFSRDWSSDVCSSDLGVLIGVAGVGMCFFLNGVSYVAVIACLLAMRVPPFVTRPMPSSAWEGVRQAVAFIQGDARVWALVALVAVFSVLGFPFIVLMPVIARDVLH